MADDRTLLIVDDDPISVYMTSDMCRAAFGSCNILTTADSDEILDLCTENRIDCVLMDLNLPGHDGLFMTRRIRETFPHLAIVLCTGVGDEIIAKNAFQAGVNDYIPKSRLSPDSIYRAVSNAIELTERARIIEEQHQDIESFAHTLAHDFKQPVRQIVTSSALARKALTEGDDESLDKLLGFLDQAANRLDRLVAVLQEFTLQRSLPEMTDVEIRPLIGEICQTIDKFVQEKKAHVKVTGDLTVHANATLLAQIFQNLLINGMKFNKSDVPCIEVALDETRGRGRILVRDNGIGIEPDYLEAVFRPLTRLHSRTDYEGSGLGLTLARKAAQAMQGEIRCQSEVGKGTEFIVSLPLSSQRRGAIAAH